MKNLLSPMKLLPSFKDYLWGGSRLVSEFGKNTSLKPVAESWEVSCHPDGASEIASGVFAGNPLRAVLEDHPEMISQGFQGEFPILIKFIDAEQSLSLQVHPNNDYAKANENQLGKNEMWYVVDALPGAQLIVGTKIKVSREELEKKIKDNSILEIANSVPVKAGDCFEIPAGLLHAIGAGVLIAEVQQSSNVTYRVYDYDRRDASGNLRELHLEKAVDVIDSSLESKNCGDNPKESLAGYDKTQLTNWSWFSCSQLDIHTSARLESTPKSFHALLAIDGSLTLNHGDKSLPIKKGDSVFIPAGAGLYELVGKGKVILTSI